ncbi:coiled-coil domain-containing protein 113-like, partial [Notechis scutatus]|uniref:Coiled-coil domain-containing protein 113-like n=1 Tax=Notechis scutatus TaxID=8663 RepID=A0A6J1W1P9_9SAUR
LKLPRLETPVLRHLKVNTGSEKGKLKTSLANPKTEHLAFAGGWVTQDPPFGLQPRGRRKSKSRITVDRVICLTVEQKCDLVQRDLDETKEELQLMKENSERSLQNYLAILEEADIRLVEIKRAMIEFDKDIVKTITKKKGSVIASDKVLRYMEDRIRSRDVMKEKIHLKNDSLKVQKQKMQMQLKQVQTFCQPIPDNAGKGAFNFYIYNVETIKTYKASHAQ